MRNAEKDREIIAGLVNQSSAVQCWSHYLERAVAAEQRVAELENTLRQIMSVTSESAAWTEGAVAHRLAIKALKGSNE